MASLYLHSMPGLPIMFMTSTACVRHALTPRQNKLIRRPACSEMHDVGICLVLVHIMAPSRVHHAAERPGYKSRSVGYRPVGEGDGGGPHITLVVPRCFSDPLMTKQVSTMTGPRYCRRAPRGNVDRNAARKESGSTGQDGDNECGPQKLGLRCSASLELGNHLPQSALIHLQRLNGSSNPKKKA